MKIDDSLVTFKLSKRALLMLKTQKCIKEAWGI